MVEVVYTPDLKSCGQHDLAGSSPAPSTRSPDGDLFFSHFFCIYHLFYLLLHKH